MKRVLALVLSLSMLMMLAACGGTKTVDPGMSAAEISDAIQAAAPMEAPTEVNDAMLEDLFYVDPEWVEDYAASFSSSNSSSDTLAVIHATSGNAASVAEALQARQADVSASFEQYLPEQAEKADNALLYTEGDWVILAINDDCDAISILLYDIFG